MRRFFSVLFGLALMVEAVGCANDTNVDPTGNWSMTLTWGGGSCGLSSPVAVNMTITMAGNGTYVINESDPSITVTGSVTCTADACKVSATESGTANGAPTTIAYNLTLHADDKIDGSGSISISGSSSCSQTFTVSGTKS